MTKSWRDLSLEASVESNEVHAAECEWEKNLCHQVVLLQNVEGNEHLFEKKKKKSAVSTVPHPFQWMSCSHPPGCGFSCVYLKRGLK